MALALADVKRRIDERQDVTAVETVTDIQDRTIDLAHTIRHFSHQLHPVLEGDVQVLSSIGHGTTVQARVPLPSPAPQGVNPGNETAVSNA